MAEDPRDVHQEFTSLINMSPTELDNWEDSDNREVYREKKSGGEDFGKPLADIMRLKETPVDQWKDKDDGFNEVEEANQAISFISRMKGNESGDPMPGTDPELSKRDASLLEWGHDPNPGTSDFTGDRQR